MQRAHRIVLVVAVALLFLSTGAVGLVSYASAVSLLHPARDGSAATPASVGLRYENVSFTASDGVDLAGWWIPAESAKGTVLFLHGYGDAKKQSLTVAPFLHEAGYDVLAFDFRAHGASGGDHTTVGLDEVRDVEAAVAWVEARVTGNASRLALMGFSMGAATAINAAPHLPEVRAIVADSSFASLTDIASNSITHFTHLPKWPFGPLAVAIASAMIDHAPGDDSPVAVAAHLSTPLLVIQGLADDIAQPGTDGEAIARADPHATLWEVPRASHVASVDVDPVEYRTRVLGFLASALNDSSV